MPSPVGHALGGFIAGSLVQSMRPRPSPTSRTSSSQPGWDPPSEGFRRESRLALAFALTGMAADLDLLVGRHSQFTHSLGMSLLVLALALLLLRRHPRWLPLSFAFAAAYASHPLLDWLGQDATAPFGITALWPFSGNYYLSHADIFWGISREPWRQGAIGHDLAAIGLEVLLLAPLAVLAWWLGRRRLRPPAWQNLPRAAGQGRHPLPADGAPGGRGESGAAQ